jgi:hypothetical protein
MIIGLNVLQERSQVYSRLYTLDQLMKDENGLNYFLSAEELPLHLEGFLIPFYTEQRTDMITVLTLC